MDRCAALGQREDEVRRHEGDRAGDEDLEIGGAVGVDVALDPGVGAVEEITQLAAGARESGGADEREGLVARRQQIGVHPGHVDDVVALHEIEDAVGACAEPGLEGGDPERVIVVAAGHVVDAGAADDEIVAVAAGQGVVPGLAAQRVVAVVAGQRVVAAAAEDDVVEHVAGAGEIAAAGIVGEILDVGAERVAGQRRIDAVHALAGGLGDAVAGIVDDIDVVAGAALHRVGTDAAVEHVAVRAAIEEVVAIAAEQGVEAVAAVKRV